MSGDEPPSREELQRELQKVSAKLEQVVKGQQDQISTRVTELEHRVNDLERDNQNLRGTLDALMGVADDEASTPEKRVQDIKHLLINKAQSRAAKRPENPGTIQWRYGEVLDRLEELGHGELYPQQAYRVMEDLGAHDGFGHMHNDSGDQVIRVSIPILENHGVVNSVNNDGEVDSPPETANATISTT